MPNVVMYTSQTCPYCSRAKALLTAKGVEFAEQRIDLTPGGRAALVELTGRRTVPQILIDDRPLGGYDDLVALNRSGELDTLLGV
jgi:glutaredoxin 3